jgi:tripartite ATP-independent transporter DctM subunit
LRNLSWSARFAALKDLMPIVLLIMGVLGFMYGGIATPSEAAAIGVVGALVLAGAQRQLTLPVLERIAVGSILTCAMIALIVLGASILGSAAAFLGVPRAIAQFVSSLDLSPMALIFALILVYLVLGCFLEGFSMIVITLPVALPIVVAAGFDPIWFGVFLVLVVEMAQITPPAGFNLLIIQGMTGEDLGYVARASLPYLAIMIAFTLALAAFPQVVLWLPRYI